MFQNVKHFGNFIDRSYDELPYIFKAETLDKFNAIRNYTTYQNRNIMYELNKTNLEIILTIDFYVSCLDAKIKESYTWFLNNKKATMKDLYFKICNCL